MRYFEGHDGRYRETMGLLGFNEDEDPRWVDPRSTRSKERYPYSYSEFFHFGSRDLIKRPGVGCDYSDRIWQWDRAKADRLWGKYVAPKRFCQASRAQLSAFMSAFHGRKLEVVALAEGCDAGGFPYHIVWTAVPKNQNENPRS